MRLRSVKESTYADVIHLDSSYSGQVIIKGQTQFSVRFGTNVMFITGNLLCEGVLERMSDSGYNPIIDGQEVVLRAPVTFFAALE